VLSGALVDRDLTRYPVPGSPAPVNLVAMQEAYFSPADGVFLDGIGSKSGGSFWYELFPSILAGALVAEHPAEAPLAEFTDGPQDLLRGTALLVQRALLAQAAHRTGDEHIEPDLAAQAQHLFRCFFDLHEKTVFKRLDQYSGKCVRIVPLFLNLPEQYTINPFSTRYEEFPAKFVECFDRLTFC
jgi:hypothetical protein